MKQMNVTDFKSHALNCINQVFRTREELVIMKHEKPVARLVPYTAASGKLVSGKLAHTLVSESDIVSPFGEELWHAAKK